MVYFCSKKGVRILSTKLNNCCLKNKCPYVEIFGGMKSLKSYLRINSIILPSKKTKLKRGERVIKERNLRYSNDK